MATTPPAVSLPRAMPGVGDDGHQLVAVDDLALLVDDDDAVGVAVERDADVGAHFAHLGDQRLRLGRAALVVDVAAVRLDADLDDLGAQLPQRLGRHLVAGAVGAIDDDAQTVEAQVLRQRALGELDIALLRALNARGAADAFGRGEQVGGVGVDQLLDAPLGVVGQLVAVGIEQLDAVVVGRIVRGGDHHAEIGAQRARQHGDGGRRHRAEQEHVHADGGEARHQRRLEHVARQARVLADDHAMAVVASRLEDLAGGHADLQRHLGRHRRLVGETANTVSTEIPARHGSPLRSLLQLWLTVPGFCLHRLLWSHPACEHPKRPLSAYCGAAAPNPDQILWRDYTRHP